ncbi:MAG: hypothetical protein ACF8QF_08980 [Phycisphaerales bacterium]
MTRRPRRLVIATALFVAAVLGAVVFTGCSTTYDRRNPVGERFPSVVGQSLEKETVALPEDLAGEPAVILVGYRQRTQFDIDRWLLGLLQADVRAQLLEVPTIPGLAPTFASGWIDDGMRSGIPREDWGAVVTLYGKRATPVAKFTGNDRGRLARILVLDSAGEVVWFDDEGYSPRKALEIKSLTDRLAER